MKNKGFTLVEVLAVISLIGVLIILFTPSSVRYKKYFCFLLFQNVIYKLSTVNLRFKNID